MTFSENNNVQLGSAFLLFVVPFGGKTLGLFEATQSLTQVILLYYNSWSQGKKTNVLFHEVNHGLVENIMSDNNYYIHITLFVCFYMELLWCILFLL